MQQKRNLRLLISLVILTGLCIVFALSGLTSSTVEVDENLFRVEDQTRINKVILERAGSLIELQFDGSKWVINNTFEADRQLIKILFATLLQAQPKRPIPDVQRDSVGNRITKKGVHIKLFEGEKTVKDFWVAGNNRKTETYFQLAGDKISYLVTIPGYRLYVASIFELSVNEFRDKRIFNFNWQNFKSLAATFSSESKESFTIVYQNQYFGLDGLLGADTTKLNNYLDAVSLLEGAKFIEPGESLAFDSLLTAAPLFTIRVADIANRVYQLEVFPKLKAEPGILGRLSDKSTIVFDPAAISPIARKKSYFKE